MRREADGFGTRAVHAGQAPDRDTGAIMTPLFLTSTYVQDGVAKPRHGHEYARVTNPTRTALEGNLASLESGEHGLAFASGLAAIEAILKANLSAGDHVVCGDYLYGGSERLFRFWERYDLRFDYVDTSDLEELRAAVQPTTRMVYLETPTNPLMRLTDLAASAEIARDAGALLVVDNTFATPALQRPLELGADVVVHSTTKYLNGHSDVVGGAVIVRSDDQNERLRYQQMATGGVPGPLDCWLVLRATKTLHLRMRAHCENAREIATYLDGHEAVSRVLYPGLPSHPQYELAARQMSDFGGMITVDMVSGERAEAMASSTRLFALAESLGGVESLISVPSRMTHASIPAARRQAMGLTDGLVRLSVGVEDVADLIDDLDRALAAVP
ncbi:MAG: cystathionine gamma-synthase [Gemmatimonadetes bacterium]|nr:cystathionine gamma-synthase [Gemmatimonadota bacterium]